MRVLLVCVCVCVCHQLNAIQPHELCDDAWLFQRYQELYCSRVLRRRDPVLFAKYQRLLRKHDDTLLFLQHGTSAGAPQLAEARRKLQKYQQRLADVRVRHLSEDATRLAIRGEVMQQGLWARFREKRRYMVRESMGWLVGGLG